MNKKEFFEIYQKVKKLLLSEEMEINSRKINNGINKLEKSLMEKKNNV